jgi:hypothetical protein
VRLEYLLLRAEAQRFLPAYHLRVYVIFGSARLGASPVRDRIADQCRATQVADLKFIDKLGVE